MRILLAALIALAPSAAFALGSDDSAPPKKTNTSKYCKGGKIWDKRSKRCVYPRNSSLTDETRYEAARELAYAGQYENSIEVLKTMADQKESRVLTYYGFNNRKAGRVDVGMKYYQEALTANPNNLLVRSYMGMGFVEQGDKSQAWAQLREIVSRGGEGTWAEVALRKSIESGQTYSY